MPGVYNYAGLGGYFWKGWKGQVLASPGHDYGIDFGSLIASLSFCGVGVGWGGEGEGDVKCQRMTRQR